MKKQSIIDIPKIQSMVKSRHQKFVKKYGNEIQKVLADHKFYLDLAVAKVNRIATILKEEGVVDKIVINDNLPIAEIRLWKEGMISYLTIYTNGKTICFKGVSYSTFGRDIETNSVKYYSGIDNADFDWFKFSSEIVDYVYSTLYEKKEVLETKFAMMFDNMENK